MSSTLITPPNPPFPTPRNFPFQPLFGIQISNRMSESTLGLITPSIRQKGGRFKIGSLPVVVKLPPVINCAAVIVVLGSFMSSMLLQATTGLMPAWLGFAPSEMPPSVGRSQPFGLNGRDAMADAVRANELCRKIRPRRPNGS